MLSIRKNNEYSWLRKSTRKKYTKSTTEHNILTTKYFIKLCNVISYSDNTKTDCPKFYAILAVT